MATRRDKSYNEAHDQLDRINWHRINTGRKPFNSYSKINPFSEGHVLGNMIDRLVMAGYPLPSYEGSNYKMSHILRTTSPTDDEYWEEVDNEKKRAPLADEMRDQEIKLRNRMNNASKAASIG